MAKRTKYIHYRGKRYKVTGTVNKIQPLAIAYFFYRKGKARGWHKVENYEIRIKLAKLYKGEK